MQTLPTYSSANLTLSSGLVFFLLLISLPCWAQQAGLERLWTGLKSAQPVSDIAVKGDAGYVVSSRGLEVYDLSATPELQLLTTLPIIPVNDPRARVADDTLLLVWDVDTGVSLYSVAEPMVPRFLRHLPRTGVVDATAKGDQIFMAAENTVWQTFWKRELAISYEIISSLGAIRKLELTRECVYALSFWIDNDVIHVARLREGAEAEYGGFVEPDYLFIQDIAVRDSVVYVVPSISALRAPKGQAVLEYVFGWDGSFQLNREYRLSDDMTVESIAIQDSVLVMQVERSLVAGQSQKTLLSARFVEDTTLVFVDTLEVGLVGGSVDEYGVGGGRLFWHNYTSLYAGKIDKDGLMDRRGDRSIGMLCRDVSGSGRDRVFALTTDTLFGMDFSDPRNPVYLSRTPIRAEGVAMVNRDRLIVFDSVVTLFDVSDPRKPKVLDRLNLGEGRIVWEAEVKDSVIVLCCLTRGTVVLVMSGEKLERACEVEANSTDALWLEGGLLLTTLEKTVDVWEEFPVVDSRYEWSSPDRMKVWGKTGQSLTRAGDTVIVATGDALMFFDSHSFPERPVLRQTTNVVLGAATGIEYKDGILYVEVTGLYFFLYRLEKEDLSIRQLGWWHPYWLGDQRFYITDSLLFAPEGIFTFQCFGISFDLLGVPVDFNRGREMPNLQVAPNIVEERASVLLTLPTRSRVGLVLYDNEGKVAREIGERIYEAGSWRVEVNVSDLPSGKYWLRLEGEEGSAVAPVQIVR